MRFCGVGLFCLFAACGLPTAEDTLAKGGVAAGGTGLRVVVQDTQGVPLSGAMVSLLGAAGRAMTNARGEIELSVPAGAIDLEVSAPGHTTARWLGVRGRRLTIPLGVGGAAQPVTVTMTIDGLPPGLFHLALSGTLPFRPFELAPPVGAVPRTDCQGGQRCQISGQVSSASRPFVLVIDASTGAPAAIAVSDTTAVEGALIQVPLMLMTQHFDLTAPVGVIGVPGLAKDGQVAVYPNSSMPGGAALSVPEGPGYLKWAFTFQQVGNAVRARVVRPLREHVQIIDVPPAPQASRAGNMLNWTYRPGTVRFARVSGGSNSADILILDERTTIDLGPGGAVTLRELPVVADPSFDLRFAQLTKDFRSYSELRL